MNHIHSQKKLLQRRIKIIIAMSIATASTAQASFNFIDATQQAGISHISPSFGASWGDFNGDGYPDIWVSNHYSKPSLYLNQGNGVFVDIIDSTWLQNNLVHQADTHGAAWADYDNDGDQDLLEYAGGNGGGAINPGQFNHMFINDGGVLTDKAIEMGLANPETRSRTPTWFDWNNDGLLDVVLTAWLRPDGQGGPGIFTQGPSGNFIRDDITTGVNVNEHSIFSHLTDLTGDGLLDLLFHGNSYPISIYDYSTLPFTELSHQMVPSRTFVSDVAAQDFLGDGKTEILLARRGDPSGVTQVDQNNIKGRFRISKAEHGVTFNTSANSLLTFTVYLEWIGIEKVFIGSSGYQPISSIIQLSSDDVNNHGIMPHVEGVDVGVFIGYDPIAEQWSFSASTNNINFYIESDQLISNYQEVGFSTDQKPGPILLWQVNHGVFEEISAGSGIREKVPCGRVTTGDYDNDMDIDVYMVCMTPYGNSPNVAFENIGSGQFIMLADGAGAIGSNLGRGESVVSADYNLDGFLDLFVVNGEGAEPFHNGPHELFQNTGNSNNWIQLDLEGVNSNRDGIGSTIHATTGGVTQYREQSGGMHSVSQDFQRVHFGLAGNTQIDTLEVRWPSGIRQQLNNIKANQILQIQEPGLPFSPGQPNFILGEDSGVYVWKESFDGPYAVRALANGSQKNFNISLVSTKPLSSVAPKLLEAADELISYPYGFSLNAALNSWQDGVDFSLAPAASAMISVTESGKANPRLIKYGSNTTSYPTIGWIKPAIDFPLPKTFSAGVDAGTFVSRRFKDGKHQLRWNSNGVSRHIQTQVISSHDMTAIEQLSVETDDQLVTSSNSLDLVMHVVGGADGINYDTAVDALIGLSITEEGLFQSRRVNPTGGLMGEPNAYKLPLASPKGEPIFDYANQAGVFVWKDEFDIWHLRLSAGGASHKVTGTIASSQPLLSVEGYRLEASDILDQSVPGNVSFTLGASSAWQDGLDFRVAEGATLILNIESATAQATDLLKIGEQQWPVSTLPVDLTGW